MDTILDSFTINKINYSLYIAIFKNKAEIFLSYDGKPGSVISYVPKSQQFSLFDGECYSIKFLLGMETKEALLISKLFSKLKRIMDCPNGFILFLNIPSDFSSESFIELDNHLKEIVQ
ncbi:hypothetical protein WA158_007344 [Blastocystis sp. Blastoise]